VSDVVEFTGFYPKDSGEWMELMSRSSVGVLPSIWYDNAPVAISESLVFKSPVIVSDLGGTKEIIEDGKSGFVFESYNSDNLVKYMKIFIQNPELIKKMGENAKKRVDLFNNEDVYYKGLMKIYDIAMNKK
jgi:glycosyltransferase involved in cell wall biosynthesis